MQNILKNTPEGAPTSPWVLLLMLIGYVFVSLILFQLLGVLVTLPFYGFDFDEMLRGFQNPYGSDTSKIPMMITQAITSFGAFIIAPYVFLRKHLNQEVGAFLQLPTPRTFPILMTAMLVFCFMVANSILIEWNQNIVLPEFLGSFERWAQDLEERAEKLTLYLTAFDGNLHFLLALVAIAILPAIGEELLFRGLIQNLFHSAIKNAHVAIWVSGLLFSIFHFQFYGLVPRMMLGVLFGYIYYWSGSLSLAMFGHFINNAFSLTIYYFSQQGIIELTPEELESSPPYYVILLFLGAGSFFMYLFRNYFLKTIDE